jgi:hypothetical protein
MITFFTSPRPFKGQFDKLQRMAIQSWLGAVPGCQIILMGDAPGAGQVAQELGITRCLDVAVNEQTTPLVNSLFTLGERYATHGWLCEISTDITMDIDIVDACLTLAKLDNPFVVGQRWDIDVDAKPSSAVLHPPCGIDYFLYRRGTLPVADIPPFAVGKTAYDNWLVWAAQERWGMSVIDATEAITAIHVNHPYPEYGNKVAMFESAERAENLRLSAASGCRRLYGIDDAPWVLTHGQVKKREPHVA